MTDFNYKKYSLENLENWLHDAMSAGEATPQEIYDVIVGVVKENYYIYKHQTSQAYELLALLNGNGKDITNNYEERLNSHLDEFFKVLDEKNKLTCDKDDKSPECQKAWNDFWMEDSYIKESSQYSEEELNAMCDKAASEQEKEKCREYNLREAEYYDKRAKLDANPEPYQDYIGWQNVSDSEFNKMFPKKDKVVKWQLPVEVDGLTGDCFIQFPDDLLEAANLKEGDQVEWIDLNNGNYELRKVNGTK